MRMITSNALQSWSRFKESRTLDPSEYVEWADDQRQSPAYRLIFVSHRWITPEHPDPDGSQLLELKQRLAALPMQDSPSDPIVVFYDYCSLPQRPRTAEEESGFYRDLSALEALSRLADQFIVLSEGYGDYKNRAWCFFEAITARSNMHFFDDQKHIKEDLHFLEFLMGDLPQITSYDMSYKLDVNEAEIIVAVFQHLRACRVTHPDDAPLIKDQVIAHYNKRRLTSFGKLIVALNKYFDVEFGMVPAKGGGDVYVCRPFFEQPEWTRLPSLETRALSMGGGRPGPSLFALPRETLEEMEKRYTHGYLPLLRLSLPGIDNVKDFLKTFQTSGDWERCVVNPILIGERGDCFPSIDHVIHTILERPPGFFCSKDSQYLYFFLSGN